MLHFPQGPPLHDEKLVKRWLKELAEATEIKDDVCNDIVNEVMQLAMQQWKAREPGTLQDFSKANATSFSLLDQLSAMPKRIFYDEIETASTPAERLQLLQQVDHVDDVSPEWKKILNMLFVGLTEGDYVRDYITLHRKWFDQCGSSSEYTSLQLGLCANLVRALRHFFGNHVFVSEADSIEVTAQHQQLFELMQQWHAMWMMAMKNFAFDDCNQMACNMMQLMRNLAPGSPSKFVFLPAHFMALVDRYGDWFALWIGHAVPPADAGNYLLSTGLFYDLMECRCRHKGHIEWKEHPNVGASDTVVIRQGEDVQVAQLERALWVQSLCMARSILVSTRVVLFPWKKLLSEAPRQVPHTCLLEAFSMQEKTFHVKLYDEAPDDEVRWVTTYFLNMLEDKTGETKLTEVCLEAIEAILWGLQDEEIFRIILSEVLHSLSCMWQGRGAVVFTALVRVYRGRDWTRNEALHRRLIDFLLVLKHHCGKSQDDPEFADFEATLKELITLEH